MSRNDGLWIFIAVVALDVHGLLCDLLLWYWSLTTVTEFARRNVWAAAVIVGVNAAGVVGLGFHLRPEGKQQ